MYQPPHFREDRLEVQHALIRSQPLGLLVTAGPGGLQANHIPFLVDTDGSPHGTLRAHLARGNPQWPSWPRSTNASSRSRGRKPTSARHFIRPSTSTAKPCRRGITSPCTPGVVRRSSTTSPGCGARSTISPRTMKPPAPRRGPSPTRPKFYVAAQLKGIAGIEIPIARIEGKWKVSQNRPAVDRAGVVDGLRGSGGDAEIMAALVAERGKNEP